MSEIVDLTYCSRVFIVDVKQVNAGYEITAIFHYLEHIPEILGSTKQM